MATEGFARQDSAVRGALARSLGAEPSELVGGRVVVVDRPDEHWGFTAIGTSFPDATLLTVAPELRDVALSLDPVEHRQAISGPSWEALVDAARAHDLPAGTWLPGIGWALARLPGEPVLPGDLTIEPVDAGWLNEQIPTGEFPNGAGPPDGSAGRSFRNIDGLALVDRDGRCVALAGIFFSHEMHEIGVDVAPSRQGEGLGVAVVALAARRILDRGEIPYYGCSPTNIRSQRTAIAVGFSPVCAQATIT